MLALAVTQRLGSSRTMAGRMRPGRAAEVGSQTHLMTPSGGTTQNESMPMACMATDNIQTGNVAFPGGAPFSVGLQARAFFLPVSFLMAPFVNGMLHGVTRYSTLRASNQLTICQHRLPCETQCLSRSQGSR